MIKEFGRAKRIAKELQKKISIIFNQEIKNPYIKMVTVSLVEVSSDFSYAKVFVTFLTKSGQEFEIDEIKNNINLLNSNVSKYIRFLLSKSMRLRIIPKLMFFYDSSFIEGMRISNLINNIINDDKKRYPYNYR
ncbi:MAG: 30S ribosome-binding factor RbfA [Arsenophonus endosymbiont of Ceratovacuna japonica]